MFSWMHYHFSLVGDTVPNSHGELHLEPIERHEVHDEYKLDMDAYKLHSMSLSYFEQMWHMCFPYVRIREFKNVTGKCEACAFLSNARRTLRGIEQRSEITMLHSLHRSMYMGERAAYHTRKGLAESCPPKYCSIISDGMAQSHCEVPWFANNNSWNNRALPQHLQGCLNHGRNFTVYRTFHNVMHDSNLQLHCFLSNLESVYKKEGNKLPDTVFYQIDGGSENIDKRVFAACELLVAKWLTCKVVPILRICGICASRM